MSRKQNQFSDCAFDLENTVEKSVKNPFEYLKK